MLKCPECGANFPQTNFVCQYCGYVNTERVYKVDNKSLSFSEQMQVIDSNLNALYEIHHPTVSDAILKIVRIWLAIQTFGIILIFWKKSKEKFDKKRYNKLKAIVQRNIEQLKLSSKGSNELLNKIEVTEKELKNIDTDIKKNIKSKKIVTLSVIFIYIAIVFVNVSLTNSNKKVDKNNEVLLELNKEYSYGNLTENFDVEVKSAVNVLSGRKYIEKLDFIIGVSVKEKQILENTEKLDFRISLLDKYGAERTDFESIPISEKDISYFRWMLENEVEKQKIIKIEFTPNKKMFSLPKDLKEFSINAHILKQNDKN